MVRSMPTKPITVKDLYLLVNGPWLENHEIPGDRPIDGTFFDLRDRAEDDLHTIVKQQQGTLSSNLYASFMDTEQVEAAGVSPIAEDLDKITGDLPAFLQALGELGRVGVSGAISSYVAKDCGSERAMLYLGQSGLGLPDEAYYRDPSHEQLRERYVEHVERMFGFIEDRLPVTPAEAAKRVFTLETEIAEGHWDVVESRDAVRSYNPTAFEELPEQLQVWLRASKATPETVVLSQPSFFTHLAGLLTEERLEDWKLWAMLRVLHSRAYLLPEEIDEANFDFYGRTLAGSTEQRARHKRALAFINANVGEDLGQLFVQKHFPPEYKQEMLSLVDYLIEAYRERISTLEWMTPITREKALQKLDRFAAKIGYPESWRSYEGLELAPTGDKLVVNARACAAFNHDYEVAKLGKSADRNEWVTTPQTVNAFYNPVVNDITFPAAILREPFFDPKANPAENFGAIGAVIGHEIGHGFDDQGSKYDGEGNLSSWWTEADRDAFNERTKKLIDQFNGLIPLALQGTDITTTGVNGRLSLGENIGDLGGLGIAVVAYQRYAKDQGIDLDAPLAGFSVDQGSPELEGKQFTGLQLLFLSWARVWRTKARPQFAQQILAIDPHSPHEFRCNVIAGNIAEFYEVFDVPEDSEMWIAPEDRVTIW